MLLCAAVVGCSLITLDNMPDCSLALCVSSARGNRFRPRRGPFGGAIFNISLGQVSLLHVKPRFWLVVADIALNQLTHYHIVAPT